MTNRLPLVAVDTCVVVDLLTPDPQRQARARWFFEQHDLAYQVVLPAIVVAEVAGAGSINGNHGGGDARQERVDKVHAWIRDSNYLVAELTERLARHAAQLASDYSLKGPDATVLATAIAWKCTLLCTRDNGLLKIDGEIPGLGIKVPEDPPLPEDDLFSIEHEPVSPILLDPSGG